MQARKCRNALSAISLFVALVFFLAEPVKAANGCQSASSGAWSASSTWSSCGGGIPQAGDTVTINAPHTVTLDVSTAALAGLTINSGATLANDSANGVIVHLASGNWTNNGTFIAGTLITVAFEGASAQFIQGTSPTTFNDLAINNGAGGSVSINTAATVNGDLLISGGLLATGTTALTLGGSLINNAGSSAFNGNITFVGAGTQLISGNYPVSIVRATLNKASSASKVSASVAVTFTGGSDSITWSNGTWEQTSGRLTFSSGSQSITANGGLSLVGSGGATFPNSITGSGGTGGIAGGLTMNTTGELTVGNGNSRLEVDAGGVATFTAGTVNVRGRLTLSAGTTTINGATINIDPQVNGTNLGASSHIFEAKSNANLVFTSGILTVVDPHSASGAGNAVQIVAGGTKNFAGSTIRLGDGVSDAQGSGDGFDVNCGGANVTLGNLIINNPSGTNRQTNLVTNSCKLGGALTISAGTFNQNAENLSVAGNWTNNGTFSPGTGTVTFNGSASTLSKNGIGTVATETFCNLTISTNTLLDVTDDLIAVSNDPSCGTLTQNGKLRREAPAQNIGAGGGTVTYTDARGVTTAQITQSNGGDLGGTTLTVTSNESPAAVACGSATLSGQPVLRHYNIAPASQGGAVILRLYYRTSNPDESNGNTLSHIAIYHCDGATWTQLTGSYTTGADANGNYVQLDGVTQFSPFAIGSSPAAPTRVTLSSFSARSEGASVILTWTTASQIHTAGFNLYRSEQIAGPYTRINARLIPASPDAIAGGTYRFNDAGIVPGATYYYQLEEVEQQGATTRYGLTMNAP